MTIEDDIELAKMWHKNRINVYDLTDHGWRATCYRLAMEVERLRSIIADALPHVTAEKWHQITLENYAESEHIERVETAMKATQNL